ncbi:MAG: LytR family transcriptional regulator [Chryseobacterium sp.]|nr:MAG: LytR family transcriptional regulator [Chryseobacterium sp.]
MPQKFLFLTVFLIYYTVQSFASQILLIGSDSREQGKRGNADVIMVITVKENEIKLTSILRDTYVYIKGYGNGKLNATYRLGGKDLLLSTINANFKTNLSQTIITDFRNTADVIDKFGGVNLHIDKGIHQYVNRYIDEQASLKGISLLPLTRTGNIKMTGDQALAYARVRVAGTMYDDQSRVERQKDVTKAVLNFAIQHKTQAARYFYDLWSLIDTDISFSVFWDICKTFLNKHKIPKSQVFPNYQAYTNERIPNVGLVLKLKDFRKASVGLNNMIK